MFISNKYILVEKLEETKEEGFQIVQVQDNFVYKGKVVQVPLTPVHMENELVMKGDTVLFAKYSPDTYEVDHEGKKYKFVAVADILAKL